MLDIITTCLLNANDHAYLALSNEINKFQPRINLLEFGQSTTNIGWFIVVVLLMLLYYSIKVKGEAFGNEMKVLVGIIVALVVICGGSSLYHKINLGEIDRDIAVLQEKMDALDKPDAVILKRCSIEFQMLGSTNNVKIVKNKDNSPSTYTHEVVDKEVTE